jgi:hypothetical protein
MFSNKQIGGKRVAMNPIERLFQVMSIVSKVTDLKVTIFKYSEVIYIDFYLPTETRMTDIQRADIRGLGMKEFQTEAYKFNGKEIIRCAYTWRRDKEWLLI